MSQPRTSMQLLLAVGSRLMQLPRRVAFVGGATTGLFITDSAAPVPRATLDVDVILDVAGYAEYTTLVCPALQALGAHEDTAAGAPMCRWILNDVLVDVMPVDSSVLGFTNSWYRTALAGAQPLTLPDGTAILVIDAPHFLATKIEAFVGRGEGDFLASKDLEDIISVVDGRAELAAEVSAAAPELRGYVAATFAQWVTMPDFHDAVLGYLAGELDAQARTDFFLARVAELIREGSRRRSAHG